MAFIETKTPTNLKVKITSKGRDLLSQGKLNFKYFEIGDSEIDYNLINTGTTNTSSTISINNYKPLILVPFDKNPKILSPIYSGSTTGSTFVSANINNPKQYISITGITSLGFFSGNTILTDSTHVKQPSIQVNIDSVNGGNSLNLYKSSTYINSSPEPAIGDILMVKWINKRGINSNNNTIGLNTPTPYLFYKITGITSGSLVANNLIVTLDRNLPNYSLVSGSAGKIAGAILYYNREHYENDPLSPIDYVSANVIKFIDNFQCDIIKYPLWNLNIIYTEEIAGTKAINLKYTSLNSSGLTGFVSYIQNQSPIFKKIGVIHYTNSSPNNTYGEGFYHNTPTINIPTLMWHRSATPTMGLTLSGESFQKTLSGLNITYYNLVDNTGYVVGKIFDGLKIIIIEDPELLFAMTFKSNRNWTLPQISVSISGNKSFCTTTVYVPTTTEYIPTTTAYVPTTTVYVPTTTSYIPTTTEYIPTTTSYVPTTTEYVPTTTEYVPTTTEYVPTTTEYVPTTTEYISITTEYVPTTTEYVATTTEYIPITTEYVVITTEYVPTTTEYISITTEYVPTTTSYIPTTTEYIPTTTAYVPTTTEYVATTTEYVPTTTSYIPTTTEYIPTTTAYVPTTTEYVPTTTSYIPTTTEYMPTTTTTTTVVIPLNLTYTTSETQVFSDVCAYQGSYYNIDRTYTFYCKDSMCTDISSPINIDIEIFYTSISPNSTISNSFIITLLSGSSTLEHTIRIVEIADGSPGCGCPCETDTTIDNIVINNNNSSYNISFGAC